MSEKIKQTQSMLAKHHGDGGEFARLMEASYASRFNDQFWQMWEREILPYLPAAPVVVDLGTGPATFIKHLVAKYPGIKAFGVECAPYMLQAVGELPANAEVIEADLQDPHLPFVDNSVDAAIASVVVHEMHQPIRMFREILRVLKPAARFYIYDWIRAPLQNYLQIMGGNPFDETLPLESLEDLFIHFIEHNRFSLDDLVFMLKNTGFRIIDSAIQNQGQHAWLLVEKPR
ncbi:MAG: class I SAM-dependent methyltransferase [Gammaproteobacteria bacterium]|nr:class I SAM-dependent methyltransferase [Gammaproteobacteria bacterium]